MFSKIDEIRAWWRKSYNSNPLAFKIEMLGFLFTVGASLVLAISAQSPDMRWIYPFFFAGSVCSFFATRMRGLAFPFLTACYFLGVNVLGFGRAVEFW